MEKFENLGRTLGGFRCVTLRSTKEDTLAGKLGEIWSNGEEGYKAVKIVSRRSDKIISFKNQELKKWILRLKVPSNPDLQLYWANNGNSRYKE